jgi:uncharacterized protein involved in tellurium resistance
VIDASDNRYAEVVGRVIASINEDDGWAIHGGLLFNRKAYLTIDMMRDSEEEGFITISAPGAPQIMLRMDEYDARRVNVMVGKLMTYLTMTYSERALKLLNNAKKNGRTDEGAA